MNNAVLGASGLQGDFMQMSSFGELQISLIPSKADPEVMELVMAAEKRKEVIRMTLQKGESIDNFTRRMKSMLMGLLNSEARGTAATPKPVAGLAKEEKPFEQAKAEMTGEQKTDPAANPPAQQQIPPKPVGTPSGPVRA